VANGVVYFASCCSHNIYAVDASTGALLWSYATGKFSLSVPAVANGMVYFGSQDNFYTDAKIYAFGLPDGAEQH
jgi:outer membrane protein assembly factor BamB